MGLGYGLVVECLSNIPKALWVQSPAPLTKGIVKLYLRVSPINRFMYLYLTGDRSLIFWYLVILPSIY